MRLHRFYVAELIGSKKEITIHSDELANQLSRVFRLKIGDSVILFDGSGFDYECVISGFSTRSGGGVSVAEKSDQKVVTFQIEKNTSSRSMPARDIYLCAAVVKKDTFEWIVEKATELGVTHIVPVMAERSEKKNLNEDRLKKIAVEASEQSGRGNVPSIDLISTLEETLKRIASKNISAIAFHTEGKLFNELEETMKNATPVALFIGSEGGWSPVEIEMFHSNKIPVVSLGNQVLRAETAVVAALSKVLL